MAGHRNILLIVFCGAWGTLPAAAAPFDTIADAVLGQPDLETNDPADEISASSLSFSFAPHVAIAPSGRLYVADDGHHRVLSWPDAASFTNGDAADLVIGQADFSQGLLNRGGAVGADGFYLPQGLSVAPNGDLWVTDAFNHRVLRFDDPVANDGVADLVFGQPDFISAGQNQTGDEVVAGANTLNYPGRVLSVGGAILVSDSGNSRVLVYIPQFVSNQDASKVYGQYDDPTALFKNNDGSGMCTNPDESGCGPPSAQNLFNPIGIAAGDPGLMVADWINNRVVQYNILPQDFDTSADRVFGQPGFTSNGANAGGVPSGMNMPADVALDRFGRLFVADSANNRVLVFRRPLTQQSQADLVIGQPNLNSTAPNHGLGEFATDDEGLFGPTGVALDLAGNLYVVDALNSRVLRFDQPLRDPTPFDIDSDDDVDQDDYKVFQDCLTGPGSGSLSPDCAEFDRQGSDTDVDLHDFALFGNCMSGSGNLSDPQCAN